MKSKGFGRTVTRAWEGKASPSAKLHAHYGYLVSHSRPAPGLTAADFLRQSQGQARFYWQDGRDPIIFAGAGMAVELFAWGNNRFDAIENQARALFKDAVVANADDPLASPRLFGGFAFRDDFTPDNTWASFHPAHFVLPHYQLLQHGDEAWLTINAHVPADEDPYTVLPELRTALTEKYNLLCQDASRLTPHALRNRSQRDVAHPSADIAYPMHYAAWEQMITAATQRIKSTELDKVVLSRVVALKFEQPADIDNALAHLNRTYPECYRFVFEPRPGHAFYGATPELLVQVDGRRVTTMGLAGSAPRSQTAAEDAAHAQALMDSAKDRHEHDLVVQAIKGKLSPLTATLDVPQDPQIYRLSNIHHLHTPIQGQLKTATGVLPLVETLHPTPALGGSPRDLAMQFIQAHEPVLRGWYAAPIGWLDYKLDGVFSVAIRSAVCQENRVWAYAGAGIVADSVPQKEWDETALKFRPMLQALEIIEK